MELGLGFKASSLGNFTPKYLSQREPWAGQNEAPVCQPHVHVSGGGSLEVPLQWLKAAKVAGK